MGLFKKTAFALTAATIAMTPIAASAAQSVDGARATSVSRGVNELEGNSSWLIGLAGLLAGIAAIIIIDSDDDEPVSP